MAHVAGHSKNIHCHCELAWCAKVAVLLGVKSSELEYCEIVSSGGTDVCVCVIVVEFVP